MLEEKKKIGKSGTHIHYHTYLLIVYGQIFEFFGLFAINEIYQKNLAESEGKKKLMVEVLVFRGVFLETT